MNPIYLECTTLPDAWFQAVYNILQFGRRFKIDRGSYAGQDRLEYDYITIRIKQPWHEPLLPKIPEQYNIPDPVSEEYLNDYLPYLMTNIKEPDEDYTYGERIYKQIEQLIYIYKVYGHRNNQMILQIARPEDMWLVDPPCCRHIDSRIQNNKLHFFPYFRSWDLFSGFPANLGAIELLKQYIAGEIGVENGEIIASSKGLHLYDYVIELAECIRGKTVKEFKKYA